MENDVISRQAAIEAIDKIFPADPMRNDYTQGITCGAALAEEYIKQLPSAQPQRKRGKWIYGEDNPGTGRDGWFCSKCGHFELWDYSADMKSAELNLPNYCPNCGADMRGEQDEAD